MGEIIDKTRGSVNEAVGRAKKTAGLTMGNGRLYIEGANQERRGRTQRAIGRIKGMFGWRV